jgi:caa(3)-type oxidase subunit IV
MEPIATDKSRLPTLFGAWAALAAATFASLVLGEWLPPGEWLALLVALLIGLKAWLVARYYLETGNSHAFIRRLTWAFVAFVPLALVLTVAFGDRLAAWMSL